MSGIEALVVVFGLFIGYWLVAKLLADKPPSNTESEAKASQRSREAGPPDQSPEWHDTLNIPPHATLDEIQKAYRLLMSQYHPDKVASLGDELKAVAERKSKEITAAYRRAMQVRGMNP